MGAIEQYIYDKIEFSSKRDINQFNPWKYVQNESKIKRMKLSKLRFHN